jgi:hypothetical protein
VTLRYNSDGTYLTPYFSVPLIIRGPGIPKGAVSDLVSTHESLAPTFLALAKGEDKLPSWVDGGVIPITPALQHHPLQASTETFSVEFWSDNVAWENSETLFTPGANTYKTLRIIGPTYDCKWFSLINLLCMLELTFMSRFLCCLVYWRARII